jgi:hypothetical protein
VVQNLLQIRELKFRKSVEPPPQPPSPQPPPDNSSDNANVDVDAEGVQATQMAERPPSPLCRC